MKINEEMMFCPICEKEHLVSIHEDNDVVEIEGENIKYIATFCRCDNTEKDNEFLTGGMTDKNLKAIKKAREEKRKIKENKKLVERYPFLLPRNRWTGKVSEDYDYHYTELDAMPDGWRKAFGVQMCEDIREELIKADYLDKYRITDIKEKYGSLRWYDFGGTEKMMREIIPKYTRLSKYTCIHCGKPATKISLGWISPWCDDCAAAINGEDYQNINSFYLSCDDCKHNEKDETEEPCINCKNCSNFEPTNKKEMMEEK